MDHVLSRSSPLLKIRSSIDIGNGTSYPINNPNESHFGLVRADGSLKPAALRLRDTFARWKAD